jgi:hypothetical protein
MEAPFGSPMSGWITVMRMVQPKSKHLGIVN